MFSGRSSTNWPAKSVSIHNGGEEDDVPGEPENSDSAGTTVLGGIMVLSAILAQSLMMVNLP